MQGSRPGSYDRFRRGNAFAIASATDSAWVSAPVRLKNSARRLSIALGYRGSHLGIQHPHERDPGLGQDPSVEAKRDAQFWLRGGKPRQTRLPTAGDVAQDVDGADAAVLVSKLDPEASGRLADVEVEQVPMLLHQGPVRARDGQGAARLRPDPKARCVRLRPGAGCAPYGPRPAVDGELDELERDLPRARSADGGRG
jgi:hypothetical protein